MRRGGNERGFSLVEMIVAMVIFGITVAVAGPNLGQLRAEYQLTGSANQLASDLAQARLQAISQNMWVKVESTGSSSYDRKISPDNSTFTAIGDSAVTLPMGMAATIPNGSVIFNRQGLANANTQITLTNGAGTKTITVNRIGRVSIS